MRKYYRFFKDLRKYLNTKKTDSHKFKVKLHPKLNDRDSLSGILTGHYFNQDLFVAQHIYKANPKQHLDIGSSTYGFVSHVASYREIDVMDIRRNGSTVKNIHFRNIDIMNLDSPITDKYDSLSCLHTIEHIGLGRYSDPVDYDGYKFAIKNMASLLVPEGVFYLSAPIGEQTVYFNAHRVFDHKHLIETCNQHFMLEEFHIVDEQGNLKVNIDHEAFISNEKKNRLGIFVLRKLKD